MGWRVEELGIRNQVGSHRSYSARLDECFWPKQFIPTSFCALWKAGLIWPSALLAPNRMSTTDSLWTNKVPPLILQFWKPDIRQIPKITAKPPAPDAGQDQAIWCRSQEQLESADKGSLTLDVARTCWVIPECSVSIKGREIACQSLLLNTSYLHLCRVCYPRRAQKCC